MIHAWGFEGLGKTPHLTPCPPPNGSSLQWTGVLRRGGVGRPLLHCSLLGLPASRGLLSIAGMVHTVLGGVAGESLHRQEFAFRRAPPTIQ